MPARVFVGCEASEIVCVCVCVCVCVYSKMRVMSRGIYFPSDYGIAGKSFGTYGYHNAGGAYEHICTVVALDK